MIFRRACAPGDPWPSIRPRPGLLPQLVPPAGAQLSGRIQAPREWWRFQVNAAAAAAIVARSKPIATAPPRLSYGLFDLSFLLRASTNTTAHPRASAAVRVSPPMAADMLGSPLSRPVGRPCRTPQPRARRRSSAAFIGPGGRVAPERWTAPLDRARLGGGWSEPVAIAACAEVAHSCRLPVRGRSTASPHALASIASTAATSGSSVTPLSGRGGSSSDRRCG